MWRNLVCETFSICFLYIIGTCQRWRKAFLTNLINETYYISNKSAKVGQQLSEGILES